MSKTATVSYSWNVRGIQLKIEAKQYKRERQTFFGCVDTESGKVVAKRAERENAKTFKAFLIKIIYEFK